MNHGYFLSLPLELRKEIQRFRNYDYYIIHQTIVDLLLTSLEYILVEDQIKKILNFIDDRNSQYFLKIYREDMMYGGKLFCKYQYNSVNTNTILIDFFTFDNLA